MKAKVQKKSTVKKFDNTIFDALREIKPFKLERWGTTPYSRSISDLTNVLIHYNWGFEDNNQYPYFQTLGYSVGKEQISKYQLFCLEKLAAILYDAKLLYENNLIVFSELRDIVARVKKDTWKRFKSIEKTNSKGKLSNQKLDSDSLVLLQAKLAILENEN